MSRDESKIAESRPRRAAPLSSEDRARVDRTARRLHGELAAFVAAQPPTARHASGLARHLDVDRTTCQRAVFVATRPYPGPELFARIPGVRGLRLLVEAAGRSDPPTAAGVLDALSAAIDRYQELVAQLGGSTTRMLERIEGGEEAVPAPASTDAPRARVALFDAAAELTGRASDCWVAVYVYTPSTARDDRLDVIHANGLIGHTARPDAVPLVVHNFTNRPGDDADDATPERFESLEHVFVEGRAGRVVLEDFSSDPPPLVTARQPHEFLVHAIDERPGAPLASVDLMLAARTSMEHPARRRPSIEEVWALINFPARHLLFDVYVHRDLVRASVPSLDTHLWGPDFAEHVGDRWQTRFADAPPLTVLGPGARHPSPDAYPRMAELTEHVFSRSGLDAGDYVGHRCDVAYPLWRSGYCLSFDFTTPDEE